METRRAISDQQAYRARRKPLLLIAALLAAIALGGLFLGEFGSAGAGRGSGVRGATSAAFDLLSMSTQKLIAYGFLLLLLLLAALLVFQAFHGKPALVLSPDGVTANRLFGSKSIRWDEIERITDNGGGYYTLAGNGKTVLVAARALDAREGEVIEGLRAMRAKYAPRKG